MHLIDVVVMRVFLVDIGGQGFEDWVALQNGVWFINRLQVGLYKMAMSFSGGMSWNIYVVNPWPVRNGV